MNKVQSIFGQLPKAAPFFCILIIFSVVGCAHEKGTLQLASVMEVRQGQLQRKMLSAEETRRGIEEWRQVMQNSALATPEIELLNLPGTFTRLTDSDMKIQKKTAEGGMPPFCEAMWQDFSNGISVLAGRVEWNPDYENKTKYEFKEHLESEVGKTYKAIFEKEHGTSAAVKVSENGSLIKLELNNKYLQNNEWMMDNRYFYFYHPGYRLNVFVLGNSKGYEKLSEELANSFAEYEEKLKLLFTAGIKFKED